ncbi:MAG: hypothetical protein ACR2FF_00315 [Mycobacteriales bacterium]
MSGRPKAGGWRVRAWPWRQRQPADDLPAPPEDRGSLVVAPLSGRYLGTSNAPQVERIGGVPGRLELCDDGLLVEWHENDGAVWIAAEAMTRAHTERTVLDRVGVGDVLVVSWSHGDDALHTAFHGDDPRAHLDYVRAIEGLVHPAGTVS